MHIHHQPLPASHRRRPSNFPPAIIQGSLEGKEPPWSPATEESRVAYATARTKQLLRGRGVRLPVPHRTSSRPDRGIELFLAAPRGFLLPLGKLAKIAKSRSIEEFEEEEEDLRREPMNSTVASEDSRCITALLRDWWFLSGVHTKRTKVSTSELETKNQVNEEQTQSFHRSSRRSSFGFLFQKIDTIASFPKQSGTNGAHQDPLRRMESASSGKAFDRRSSDRSSTPGNRFPSRNARCDAFYASVEPLSVRRALHNAAGPDPDTDSAPNSRGAPRKASGPSRGERPGTVAGPSEPFYTVPRGLGVSRKEILRRRCDKDADESKQVDRRWHRPAEASSEKDPGERARTLPSMCRRTRAEPTKAAEGLKKVSRQDILRRRASVDVSSRRSPANERSEGRSSGFSRNPSRWGREEERRESRSACGFLVVAAGPQDVPRGLAPRPSTLPKIVHASRSMTEDWSPSRLVRDSIKREAPVHGRIRRRKISLPAGTVTLRGSAVNTLTRYSNSRTPTLRGEERAVDVDFPKTTAQHSDSLYNSKSLPEEESRPKSTIYAKVTRKISKSQEGKSEDNDPSARIELGTASRAVSRRKIIENAKQASGSSSFDRRTPRQHFLATLTEPRKKIGSQREKQAAAKGSIDKFASLDRGSAHQRMESSSPAFDCGTLTRFSSHRRECAINREEAFLQSCDRRKVLPRVSRIDRRDAVSDCSLARSREGARYRSKSQSRLMERFRAEVQDPNARLSTTLPSYVKNSRKSSLSSGIPTRIEARIVERQRKSSRETVASSKQSKERSNHVKKSASSHVRAHSDANSARSNSPATTSSIFGFCTGKRKVHSSSSAAAKAEVSSYPPWNIKTGELVWFDPGVGHVLPGEVLEYHRAANVLSVQAVIAGKVCTLR
ncbi:hypothetical protein KM043_011698 [Ampulex compressa]|nr:hypothetical protein KM043_011698 [Ampulex compressa]